MIKNSFYKTGMFQEATPSEPSERSGCFRFGFFKDIPNDTLQILLNFTDVKTLTTLQLVNNAFWKQFSSRIHCLQLPGSFRLNHHPVSFLVHMTAFKELEILECLGNNRS